MSETTKKTSREQVIDCPKCGVPMRQIRAGEIVVDRCEKCYGIWLDENERLKLMTNKHAVAGLDVGRQEVGREQDKITAVDCPRCGERMQHIQDRAQKHIGFEFCRQCKASFFDAGELRDLSEFTLGERIRAFFGK